MTDTKKRDGSDSLDGLVRPMEVEYRWYSEKQLPTVKWVPSCWARPTLKEAMALLEEDRFTNSGMLRRPMRLVREVKTFVEVASVMGSW